jgi:hypothetical protein
MRAGKESRMRYAFLVSAATLVVVAAIVMLTAEPAIGQAAKAQPAAKSPTPPKTLWGDPDLQGTWTSDDCIGTPMNRPVNLGGSIAKSGAEVW